MATLNAPHVYLLEKPSGNYYLFICIPHAPEYKVVYVPSTNFIFFKIEPGGDGVTKFYFNVINLGNKESVAARRTNMPVDGPVREILDNADNDAANVEETVSVEVQNNIDTANKSGYQTTLMLTDADEPGDDAHINVGEGEYSSYSPYLYLSNPSAETGVEENKAQPSLVIFDENKESVLNQIYNPLKADLSHEMDVDIDVNRIANNPMWQPNNLREAGGPSLKARIKYNNSKKTKSVIRTPSADPKPNSFLSDIQMKLKEEKEQEEKEQQRRKEKEEQFGTILIPPKQHKNLLQLIWDWIKQLFTNL